MNVKQAFMSAPVAPVAQILLELTPAMRCRVNQGTNLTDMNVLISMNVL